MSSECLLCQIVTGNLPAKKIYEDEKVVAVLDFNGAALGHTFVIPKKHFTIIEQVPSEDVGHMFGVANKIATALFESLDAPGTNIFVSNGGVAGQQVPHFMINVIPRQENDDINLEWETKQLSEEEMSTIELKLKEQLSDSPEPTVTTTPSVVAKKTVSRTPAKPSNKVQNVINPETNLPLRQIRRRA